MAKVTCKFCQKVWHNRAEYLAMKACDNNACPAMAMRDLRQVNNTAKVIPLIKEPTKVVQVPLDVKFREEEVVSFYDSNEDCLEVQVPKVICIDIYKKGGKRRK